MLNSLQSGLVMSVGPVVAALVGFPSGRLVDRAGSRLVMIWGLVGVGTGSMLMTFLPTCLGAIGYVASLAVITAGYALFQAASSTAVMLGVARERRGVVSALLNLSRNLGLITGASMMGAVFAIGTSGIEPLGLPIGGRSGLELTFTLASALAVLALAITFLARRRNNLGGPVEMS
jgi:MFS family permease